MLLNWLPYLSGILVFDSQLQEGIKPEKIFLKTHVDKQAHIQPRLYSSVHYSEVLTTSCFIIGSALNFCSSLLFHLTETDYLILQ